MEKEKSIYRKLYDDTKPIRPTLLLASLISLLSVLIALIAPQILGKLTDVLNAYAYGEQMDFTSINRLSLIMIAVYVVANALSIVKMVMMNRTVSRYFTCAIRVNLSEKIKRLPVSYIDRTSNGEIISRMTGDVSVMGNTVHSFLDTAINGVLQIVAIAVLLFITNWMLAIVVLLLLPISAVVATVITKKMRASIDVVRKQWGELNSIVEETYAGNATVRTYGLENLRNENQAEIVTKIRDADRKIIFYSGILQPIIAIVNNIGYVAVCFLGGYLAIEGVITVGAVIAVMMYARTIAGPIDSITNAVGSFQRVRSSAKRVYEILGEEEMKAEDDKSIITDGDVIFEHVDFSYDKTKELIKDLNVTIKRGQRVAIVGPTGAGKTTIVNLLMRFYETDGGRITVGGTDISTVSRESVRSVFGMVLQDTWLFKGTVFENIAYGREGATIEEVKAACDAAYCDHFIMTLPNGYQTVIGEDTVTISGGQKQLLTIARALLANRPILILDEATSNVDTRTELLIEKAFAHLMKSRTSFIIAHRLSTIVDADLILVVDDGKIVQTGTHSELLKEESLYKEIYMSQYALSANGREEKTA